MGQITYQRPREKLRDRGVGALSNIELLQVIIGSGNQGMSAARIAKNIAEQFKQPNTLTYHDLLKVRGVGFAKASQLIAAIELGNRLKLHIDVPEPIPPVFLKIKTSSKRRLEYITVSGSGEYLQNRSEIISDMPSASLAIRKMFADALHDTAGSLLVGVGYRTFQVDMLDDEILEILKMVFDTANLLEISVNVVWLVNQTSQQSFRRKALQ